MLKAADLFCGAGGTTTGAQASGVVDVVLAVNHWRTAVTTHRHNHPHARHVCAEIDMINPRDFMGMGIDVLLASPECVFHSVARGSKPVDDQRRASAWCVPRWAEVLRPEWIVVENVKEFADWGPLDDRDRPDKSRKGEIFQAWVAALRAIGYRVEWRLLNAADFGGATKRIRLFVIARKDNREIVWPTATHTKENWVGAHTIIDWSLPIESIFRRKRPLAAATIKRIEAGIRKFCGVPFQFKAMGRDVGRTRSLDVPLPTIVGARENHGVVVPFMVDVNHGGGVSGRVHSIWDSLKTVTTKRGQSLVFPFLTTYFGTGGPRSVEAPISTFTTKQRHGLVGVELERTMQEFGITDVFFRMLEPAELAAAQGFPANYSIFGSKADQVKQIGNSVHTAVAKAICQSIGGLGV